MPAAGRALLPGDVDHAEDDAPLLVRPPRRLWALGLIGLCGLLAEGASGDWSAAYVRDSLGAGAGVAGLAFAAFSLTMTAGRAGGRPARPPRGARIGCGAAAGCSARRAWAPRC